MTRAKFTAFLAKEVFPELANPVAGTRARLNEPGTGQVFAQESFVFRDGSTQSVGVTAAKTEEGIKFPHSVGTCIGPVILSKYFEDLHANRGINKMVAFVVWVDKDSQNLEAQYGLKGVLRDPDEGLLTWEAFRKHYYDLLTPEAQRKVDELKQGR